MDCFFYDGVQVMFQLALEVLRVNSAEIEKCRDDGEMMMMLSSYFQNIPNLDGGNSIKPNPRNDTKTIEADNIQNLIKNGRIYFEKYVTNSEVDKLRFNQRLVVVHELELGTRRTVIRSVQNSSKLKDEELGLLYDQVKSSWLLTKSIK